MTTEPTLAASRPRNSQQNGKTTTAPPVGPVGQSDRSRLLGQVRLAAQRHRKVEAERDRAVVRAKAAGCSLRDIADAASFGSHHRVSELLKRIGKAEQ